VQSQNKLRLRILGFCDGAGILGSSKAEFCSFPATQPVSSVRILDNALGHYGLIHPFCPHLESRNVLHPVHAPSKCYILVSPRPASFRLTMRLSPNAYLCTQMSNFQCLTDSTAGTKHTNSSKMLSSILFFEKRTTQWPHRNGRPHVAPSSQVWFGGSREFLKRLLSQIRTFVFGIINSDEMGEFLISPLGRISIAPSRFVFC